MDFALLVVARRPAAEGVPLLRFDRLLFALHVGTQKLGLQTRDLVLSLVNSVPESPFLALPLICAPHALVLR